MYNHQEDIWLQQLTVGDEQAYRQLFDRYYGLLALFAERYVRDKQLAEDAVHDVLMNLYERRERFGSIVLLKSYLYNSVRNRCLNILEHRKVRESYASCFADDPEETAVQYAWLEMEIYEQLREAIQCLPAQQREIFDLTLMGFDNAEISEKLGITIDAVKGHKKRGRKLLKQRFQNLWFFVLVINCLFE